MPKRGGSMTCLVATIDQDELDGMLLNWGSSLAATSGSRQHSRPYGCTRIVGTDARGLGGTKKTLVGSLGNGPRIGIAHAVLQQSKWTPGDSVFEPTISSAAAEWLSPCQVSRCSGHILDVLGRFGRSTPLQRSKGVRMGMAPLLPASTQIGVEARPRGSSPVTGQ